MKKNRVITTIAGVLLFLSIVLTFVWFYPTNNTNPLARLEVADVVSKINKHEVKKINLKRSQVELTDVKDNKYFAIPGTERVRKSLLNNIRDYSKTNTNVPIKYSEEPVSSRFGGIV